MGIATAAARFLAAALVSALAGWPAPAAAGPATEPAATASAEAAAPGCKEVVEGLEERVAASVAPLADAVKARIPEFGEWLFGWSASYERERALVGAGFSGAIDGVRQTGPTALEPMALWSAAEERMNATVQDSYRQIVLDPLKLDQQAEAAWRALLAETDVALLRSDGTPEAGIPDPTFVLPPDTVTDSIVAAAGDPDREALVRAPRVILARLAGWALRRSVGLSLFGVVRLAMDTTDLGLVAAVPALALGYAGAFGTAIGLDYLLLKADEQLNRAGLEAEFVAATDRAFAEVGRLWTDRLTAHTLLRCPMAAGGPRPAAP